MPDNASNEKKQAEALSAAIDRLNQGSILEAGQEEEEIAELLYTAWLLKEAAQPPSAVPAAVLHDIVEQASSVIKREKRKKRLSRLVAGCVGVAAAVAAVVFLHITPPPIQDQQLAKGLQALPAPADLEPPVIKNPPVEQPARQEIAAPTTNADAVEQMPPPNAAPPSGVALALPTAPVPAAGDVMLALAERKADNITIDAVSQTIRQVYHKGAPDEIILTQAPKRADVRGAVTALPREKTKMAAVSEKIDAKVNSTKYNKVTVIVEDKEVTLEGAVSREELLRLAGTLTKTSVTR